MNDRRLIGAAAAVLLLVLLAILAWRVASGPEAQPRRSTGIGEAIAPDPAGYRRAEPGTQIRFPRDHGAHPDYQLEWWYLTANLRTDDGRRFGVQFTIFRNALAPPDTTMPDGQSAWSTRQLYLAHAAITDVESGRFEAVERLSRGAAGLAFARAQPLEVRVEDWFIRQTGRETFPAVVSAGTEAFGFELELSPVKPVVLQGDRGYSPKGPDDGQASMYYSYTRLRATGTIRAGDESFRVDGQSWMDREWSTSFLGPDQIGWDWFSIQLEDGRDLMLFQLRTANPSGDAWKEGTLVAADGTTRRIDPAEFTLEPGRTWASASSGAAYPVEWRVRVPSESIDLNVRAVLDAQELNVSVDYWEGAVDAYSADSERRSGSGYLEMTGYAASGAIPGME
ncbi:MAG: carotenoid 1,2-hydratase [Rhodothermales bacterium]|nr:carotenoid 1,2-hydratase [Rhodothermales bacterium]